jgi:hypothetical protein
MLDFQEWLTNYLKITLMAIGTGRTIAPKSGVPAGVTMLARHNAAYILSPYPLFSVRMRQSYT